MKPTAVIVKMGIWFAAVALFVAVMIAYSGALASAKPDRPGFFHINLRHFNFGTHCEPEFTLPGGELLQKERVKSFTVAPGGDFMLASCFGDVEIRTWEKNEIEVRWSAKDEAALDGIEVRTEQQGNRVRVAGTYKDTWKSWWSGPEVKFFVTLPADFHPKISVSGGDVRAANLRGNVEIETSGGNITLDSIGGRTRLETSGGDIAIRGSGGEVHAETSGGSIRLETVSGHVYAETSGGDIEARVKCDTVAIHCETSGGDITLYLPETVKGSISAGTSGGSVGLELKNFRGKIEEGEIHGSINEGGGKISLETSGGDIRVRPL